ncbi:hypothetical protein FKM82_023249 [Ascaphus truei]
MRPDSLVICGRRNVQAERSPAVTHAASKWPRRLDHFHWPHQRMIGLKQGVNEGSSAQPREPLNLIVTPPAETQRVGKDEHESEKRFLLDTPPARIG